MTTEISRQLLTNSAAACFKLCRKKYHWSYVNGIRPEYDAKPLRMGSAGHEGLHLLRIGGNIDDAVAAVRSHYAAMPEMFDAREWEIESETVACLVSGYAWRWPEPLKIISSEGAFQIRLRNPETGAPRRCSTWPARRMELSRLNPAGWPSSNPSSWARTLRWRPTSGAAPARPAGLDLCQRGPRARLRRGDCALRLYS